VVPGSGKLWLLDEPRSSIAQTIQDRYTDKQWFEVELAFAELLLQKGKDTDDTFYADMFRDETPIIHLEKTVAFFTNKGFNTASNPSVILLYEKCGDSVKSNRLFSGIVNAPTASNNAKYQLCQYIISQAKPGSSLLQQSVATMQKLFDAAKNTDEKIVTRLELVKGYYVQGNYATATRHALDLALLLPPKTPDYCSVAMLLAQLERSQQHYASAIIQYDYVIAFATDADEKKAAMSEKANCNADMGDLPAAISIYDQLYKDTPDKFMANECAAFFINKKEYDRAEILLSKALKEDGEFYLTLLNYGDLLVATGKPRKARPFYVKAHNMSVELNQAQQQIIEAYK